MRVALDQLLSPAFLSGTVLTVVLGTAVSLRLARRYHVSMWRMLLMVGAVASIVLLSAPIVSPRALLHLNQAWSTHRAATWIQHGWSDLQLVHLGVEGWANVALYLPAALLLSSMTGRRWRVWAALTALSYLIESLQAALLVRVADPRDLYANSLGAALGVIAAAALAHRTRSADDADTPSWPAAAVGPVAWLTALALIAVGTELLLSRLADQEQTHLFVAVSRAYQDTSEADVLSAAGRGQYLAFGTRAGRPADYLGTISPGVVQARFGIQSTARPRCVLVTWTGRHSPDVTRRSGPDCLAFRAVGVAVA